jgi:hypothetical protein
VALGFVGEVYTDDLDRLCWDTEGFEFLVTDVDLSVAFFDSGRKLLGFLYSGTTAGFFGSGTGAGHWW